MRKYICFYLIVIFCLTSCFKINEKDVNDSLNTTESAAQSSNSNSESENNVILENNLGLSVYHAQFLEGADIYSIIGNNHIDKNYLKDGEKLASTKEILDWQKKYIDIWENELNESVKYIRTKLDGELLTKFNSMQKNWESIEEQEIGFCTQLWHDSNGTGSILPILSSSQVLDRTRYRTLQVIEYCILLDGNYQFKFTG